MGTFLLLKALAFQEHHPSLYWGILCSLPSAPPCPKKQTPTLNKVHFSLPKWPRSGDAQRLPRVRLQRAERRFGNPQGDTAVENLPAHSKLCGASPAAKQVTSMSRTIETGSHPPKTFPQGKRRNRKRMAGTKCQKIVSQTGSFIGREQPAPLLGCPHPSLARNPPCGEREGAAHGVRAHGGAQPCTSLPNPARSCHRSPETPKRHQCPYLRVKHP